MSRTPPAGPVAVDIDVDEVAGMAAGPLPRLPVLVKGRLVTAPAVSEQEVEVAAGEGDGDVVRVGDALVVRSRGGRLVALPQLSPNELLETDRTDLARTLYRLPFQEVLDYVAALRDVVRSHRPLVEVLAGVDRGGSASSELALDVLVAALPDLLDPEGLALAVDRELGDGDVPGRRFLDGWVPVPAAVHPGATARRAERLFPPGAECDGGSPGVPLVRAMPTRQLHVTSGGSPVIPVVSALRAFATKGAAVVKCPAASTLATTVLAVAMVLVDPAHPITRHTSLVYWPGGDAAVEGRLFAKGAFDRLVVWGSQATVDSVRARAPFTRTVWLGPRVGLSLIGNEALGDGQRDTAVRAATDSMVLDQQGCMSSLVHYVEGSEEEATAYCETLATVLARWDEAVPPATSRRRAGQLLSLRRGHFIDGTWFGAGPGPAGGGSAVVYLPHGFDLAVHPLSRLVVVRRVDRLADALRYVNDEVSTVGVCPDARRTELRDELAARGVSHVVPLGQCERVFAGMPHDGMRLLNELVSWVTG